MKTTVVLLAVLGLAWILPLTKGSAATFTNLYIFSADAYTNSSSSVATNGDGAGPNGFVISGNTIYGTTDGAGYSGDGTIFRVDTDGDHFTNLFSMTVGAPNPGLLLVSNILYGTTFYGGDDDAGTVYSFNLTNGLFAVVHQFDFDDGQGPASGLTLYSNKLYGTTAGEGAYQSGTIFSIDLGDMSFSSTSFRDEEQPYGGVVVTNNEFYGFGQYGSSSNGLVYYSSGGVGYEDLFAFDGVSGSSPYSTPALSGNTLFGVTYEGGTNGSGNVFRIDINGQNYTNLFNFQAQGAANTTGAYPYDMAGLVISGDVLYGTAAEGGEGGQGTVFQLNTDGTGFTVLHSFQYADGGDPDALALVGGTLYGTTGYGIQGVYLGDGAIFALFLQPTLNIALAANQAVLTWNDPGYSLYSGSTITNITTKITGASSPYTTTLGGAQQFFQLQAN